MSHLGFAVIHQIPGSNGSRSLSNCPALFFCVPIARASLLSRFGQSNDQTIALNGGYGFSHLTKLGRTKRSRRRNAQRSSNAFSSTILSVLTVEMGAEDVPPLSASANRTTKAFLGIFNESAHADRKGWIAHPKGALRERRHRRQLAPVDRPLHGEKRRVEIPVLAPHLAPPFN